MRAISIVIVALPLLIVGCGKQAELENQNRELRTQLAAKDQYIEEVTSTISDIHKQLDQAWSMEKKVVKQTTPVEGAKVLTHAEIRQQVFSLITDIDSTLAANRKKISNLQYKLNSAATRYAGLQKMVDDLKSTIEEREKAVAELQARVEGLESDVRTKGLIIAVQDSTIWNYSRRLSRQTSQLNAVYVAVGSRKDLKGKGIITDEGGILWGLLGSTSVLAADANTDFFQRMDKSADSTIDVAGEIDQIIPRRDASSYAQEETTNGHTILRIVRPDAFWRQNHLVIVSK